MGPERCATGTDFRTGLGSRAGQNNSRFWGAMKVLLLTPYLGEAGRHPALHQDFDYGAEGFGGR